MLLPGCAHIKRTKIAQQDAPLKQQKNSVPTVQQNSEKKPILVSFAPAMLYKKDTDSSSAQLKNMQEILDLLPSLKASSYLSLAYHVLLQETSPLKDKITLYHALKKLSHDQSTNDVLQFFIHVLSENEAYLTEHPLRDLHTSLVNASSLESSDFFKEHPEISDVVWPLEELYKTGNNLLQEAVRLNNYAAVHYLLKKGALPRHLDDPRGAVLALEWADKYRYQNIAQELSLTLNQISGEHITILDELLYKDPHAAQLVRKYGGKRAIELI